MPRYLRIYIAVAALALLAAVHYHLQPFSLARRRTPSTAQSYPLGLSAEDGQLVDSAGLVVDEKGLVSYSPGHAARHPVEILIERGKTLADETESKIASVKSLKDSAMDYVTAFGMKPPQGFEAWYAYTQSVPAPHPLSIPSLIPLAHRPMLPFLSHSASILRERVEALRETAESIFTLTFVPDGQGDRGTACTANEKWNKMDWRVRGKGRVLVRGAAGWSWRCNNTLSLLLPLLPLMPEKMFSHNPPLELAFSTEDGPRGLVHNTFRERSENLARAGRYVILNDLPDIVSAQSQHVKEPKTFIADFDRSVDYCVNPDLMNSSIAAANLIPALVACKTKWNSDLVGVPLDGVYETVKFVPWEDKEVSKAFWRGSATGLFHDKNKPWRQSQRERLHWFGTNMTGTVPLLLPDGSIKDWDRADLVDKWLDIGLSGGPTQCDAEDGSCAAMAEEIDFKNRVTKQDAIKYKYVIDVDGNGWSSRFRRLLQGNNVVFKSTLYPEWFHEILIPWYHYVPTKLDYSDVFTGV
uniref:Cap4p n=1 Tax=Cryptococcus deneoformans TaxID=40410 RepID=Q5WQW5_9TREE|nr:Cap4p [Cryptococcus neoformans var. neoformans]